VRRYGAKRDASEPGIVAALRSVGVSVHHLSAPNMPDLLCGYQGETHLLEVKSPGARRRLTPGQRDFMASWFGAPVAVVTTPEEALRAVGAIR
jgi:hypothetical protein